MPCAGRSAPATSSIRASTPSPTRTGCCCAYATPRARRKRWPRSGRSLAPRMPAGDRIWISLRRRRAITLTLSPVALNERATAAVQQSIEIVRRRIDETGVVDPQITRQGTDRIVVQLPGIEDPNRIKELLGKTAHMTFQLVDESANASASGPPPPGDEYLPMQNKPNQKDRSPPPGGRGRRRSDRRPRRDQWADRRLGGEFHLQLGRRAAFRRRHPRQRQPPIRDRAGQPDDQRPGDP